jgi:hypothetical protein
MDDRRTARQCDRTEMRGSWRSPLRATAVRETLLPRGDRHRLRRSLEWLLQASLMLGLRRQVMGCHLMDWLCAQRLRC